MLDFAAHPHRRFNPLTREWVLVSPHRTQRPWQGQTESVARESRPRYDDNCFLCPGNERAGGKRNPQFTGTFVFDNDFAALLPDTPGVEFQDGELLRAVSENGRCRVICFSPRHDVSVPDMTLPEVAQVIAVWAEEYRRFVADDSIRYVQIFENKGAVMGCSNPHPHCQIWASGKLPVEVEKEDQSQRDYYQRHQRPLLMDYLASELLRGERIVFENERFVVLVPFWAVWPFETLILPRKHVPSIACFDQAMETDFAEAYQQITAAYDRVFDCEFPYTAGIHQAPSDREDHDHWQLHMHFYPPLLRSATVKKFMVGYEMLGTPQRDITAESATAILLEALQRTT